MIRNNPSTMYMNNWQSKGIKLTYQQNVILECLNNYGKNEFGLYAKSLPHVLPEVLNSTRDYSWSKKSVIIFV